MADSLLVAALNVADADLAERHDGVDEWYVGHLDDHIYATCPGLKRPGWALQRGQGRLYPEAGDVCGLCLRWWRARERRKTDAQP